MAHAESAAYPENNFHFLRFVAALFVMITHSYALNGRLEQDAMWFLTRQAFTFSYIGLVLFFVISGYLITKSADLGDRGRIASAQTFIWKRFLRIIPALAVVVLLSVFVLGPLFTTLSVKDYFSNKMTWGYLQTMSVMMVKYDLPGVFEHNHVRAINGSLWTIPYEVVCYLGVLVLSLIGLKRTRVLVLILFVLAAVVASSLPIHTSSSSLVVFQLDLFSLIRFGFYFVGGSLIYLFRDVVKRDWRLCIACVVALIAGILFGAPVLMSFFTVPYIIIFLALAPSPLSAFAKYGDFSYGIYLYAFPVQQMIVHLTGKTSPMTLFLFSVLLVLPLAYLSWTVVERPALAYKTVRTRPGGLRD